MDVFGTVAPRSLLAMAVVGTACMGCGSASDFRDTDAVTSGGEVDSDEMDADGGARDSDPPGLQTQDVAAQPYTPPRPDRAPDDGPVRADPIDESTYLFDPRTVRTYELSVSPENLAVLNADPRAEVYVPGSLRFEGAEIGPVGVRYKGSVGAFRNCLDGLGAKLCTKLSIKVKINWEDPEAEFYGVRKLQFHSMNRDQSMMRDRLGYWVFRQAGVAAPRAVHARVLLNGQVLGLHALIEQIDGRFTRSRFVEGGKGNLYKEAWPLESDGSAVTAETLREQLRTNEDEDPQFDGMLAFAEALASRPAAELPDVFEEFTDPDYLMRYLAVDRAIGHDDGPLHWYCGRGCMTHNFYFYEELDSARLWIVAWDLDSSFNIDNRTTTLWLEWDDVSVSCDIQSNPPFNSPLRPPHCDPAQHGMALLQERYVAITEELLAGPLQRDVLEDKLTKWEEQIYPFVLEAGRFHEDAVSFDEWQQERARLRASIDLLIARAKARVERGPIPLDELMP